MLTAQARIGPKMNGALPELAIVARLKPGEAADPATALKTGGGRNLATILSGTLAHPC
jgi:hypothetical protein